MTFRFDAPITMANAQASLATCTAAIDAGETALDLTDLGGSDSSAVAVVIAARRAAAARGRTLAIRGAPPAIASLARLYGVEAFVAG